MTFASRLPADPPRFPDPRPRRRAVPALLLATLAVLLGAGCAAGGATASSAPTPGFAARFEREAVACDHPLASAAGAEVLAAGGNAVDAAVAASFALSVVRPDSCGIGGGGFMLVHDPASGAAWALDYRETTPAAVGPDHFARLRDQGRGDASRTGGHAVGVPGTVAGLLLAHERWGRLDRAAVLAPAVRIAREGWAADAHHVGAASGLAGRQGSLVAPLPAARRAAAQDAWTRASRVGDRLVNPDQAAVLARIAAEGRDGFYRGPVAERLVAAVQRDGGLLSLEDLDAYEPVVREPLRGTLAGNAVLAMPPPSSGGVAIVQTLGLLERLGVTAAPPAWGSADWTHLLAECLKHAFADRAEWLADADFVDVPVADLLSEAYLDRLAAGIDRTTTGPTMTYGSASPPPDDAGTSHLSVVDADGMAVACTETINLGFGSAVVVEGGGFMLNDELDDFTTIPGEANAFGLRQSDRNLPEPGKRPLSSMSPTIVLDAGGRVRVVAGASGGPRIITGTLQVILHALLLGDDAETALTRPRLHHQWQPKALRVEPGWWTTVPDPDGLRRALEARGHELDAVAEVGNVQVILVAEDGTLEAACDPRKGGRPAGR